MPVRIDRRTALKSLGAFAAGGLAQACSGSGSSARPLSETIDTIVVLMMENRTFDHYFGAMSLEEGRTDIDGLTAGMSNPNAAGEIVPIHLADASCITDPPHSWIRSHAQWNEGRNDGFVREYADSSGEDGHRVMGYMNRAALPVSYALADNHAVCQRWFASLMTSTWPNRFYSLAAQNNGYKSNQTDGDYDFLTIYDMVRAAGRSWGIYYGNISFSLIFPGDYPRSQFHELAQFYDDAEAGTLPNVCIVEPLYGRNDDHPPAHPLAGQVLISSVYDALARSPQWGRSLLVISYDEHGGFFDHVSPPTAPDARASEGFDQLGFRVPVVVAGPYVKQRHVSNTVRDHTSTLAFLRNLWGVRALTERDAAANDLTDLLDMALIEDQRPRPAAEVPRVEADEAVIYAPECLSSIGLVRGPSSTTGQPELERWLDAHPERAWGDKRGATDRIYEEQLVWAEKRGLLVRRGRAL